MLAMSANPLGILTAPLLEGKNLLATVMFDHFCLDGRTFYEGGTELGIGTNADNQDFVEFYNRTSIGFQLFDGKHVVGCHAVLLTAGLDDCEHFLSFHVRSGSVRRMAVFLSVELWQDLKGELSKRLPVNLCGCLLSATQKRRGNFSTPDRVRRYVREEKLSR
jgi:hypothetical protein